MQVIIDPRWGWNWVIVVALVTLAGTWWGYQQVAGRLSPGRRRLLLGLRLAAWLVLMFAILQPTLEFTDVDRKASVFAVVADRSKSMTIADERGGITRRAALLKTMDSVRDELKDLGEELDLRLYEFDKELITDKLGQPEAAGEQTAIGSTLESLLKQSSNQRLAGILMLSDFSQRALPPNDLEPQVAARRLADVQIPVHTVPFGTSGLSEQAVDLIVEDLEVNPTVFVKNTVVVNAKLRALGAADRELTARLLLEDPSTSTKPNQPGLMRPVSPPLKLKTTQNQDVLPIEMSFVAQQTGEFKLSLEVTPLDGEPVITNNAVTTYITVLKGGINVAYFDKIRPEQKFIRKIDESPDIQLDFKPVRLSADDTLQTPLEPDWFSPGKYDVYIIGDVPAKVFGPELLRKLARTCELGAGLMMTGGFRSFGGGGYAQTPLADLLPVAMSPTETQKKDDVDPELHFLTPVQMLPTTAGVQHFVMRLDTGDRNLEQWRQLAPLKGANKFKGLKPLALLLAETQQKVPLLVSQEVGRSRSMAFAADTTYQWVLAGQLDQHQRFWQQAILWLAHKEFQTDNTVWLKLNARRFRPGQPVELTFGARGTDTRPIPDAEYTLTIQGPPDRTHNVVPQRVSQDHVGKFVDTQTPGEYKAVVEARRNGQSLGTAQARFIVYEQDLELHNPAADFALAEEISRITLGTHVPPEKLGPFLRDLLSSGKLRLEVKQVTTITLWDKWPVLLLFTFLMTCEWFLRKRHGLV